jgi:hypothetical protein
MFSRPFLCAEILPVLPTIFVLKFQNSSLNGNTVMLAVRTPTTVKQVLPCVT